MREIAEVLRLILDKVLSFFSIFDLSFFVSGGVFVLAIVYVFRALNADFPISFDNVITVVAAVLVSYLCGLVNFGLGRYIRRTLAGPWGREIGFPYWLKVPLGLSLWRAMQTHQLHEEPRFAPYFRDKLDQTKEQPKARWSRPHQARKLNDAELRFNTQFEQLYTRLWAELRQRALLEPSFSHINSYWVRAAVYDGLVVAILAWMVAGTAAVLMATGSAELADPYIAATLSEDVSSAYVTMNQRVSILAIMVVIGPIGLWTCVREARRCDFYQLEELVGTIAWERDQRQRSRNEIAYRAERMALDRALSNALHDLIPPYVEQIGEKTLADLQQNWLDDNVSTLARKHTLSGREVQKMAQAALRPLSQTLRQAANIAAYGALRHSALQSITEWCIDHPSPDSRDYEDDPEVWMIYLEEALREGQAALSDERLVVERAVRDPSLRFRFESEARQRIEIVLQQHRDKPDSTL